MLHLKMTARTVASFTEDIWAVVFNRIPQSREDVEVVLQIVSAFRDLHLKTVEIEPQLSVESDEHRTCAKRIWNRLVPFIAGLLADLKEDTETLRNEDLKAKIREAEAALMAFQERFGNS